MLSLHDSRLLEVLEEEHNLGDDLRLVILVDTLINYRFVRVFLGENNLNSAGVVSDTSDF